MTNVSYLLVGGPRYHEKLVYQKVQAGKLDIKFVNREYLGGEVAASHRRQHRRRHHLLM